MYCVRRTPAPNKDHFRVKLDHLTTNRLDYPHNHVYVNFPSNLASTSSCCKHQSPEGSLAQDYTVSDDRHLAYDGTERGPHPVQFNRPTKSENPLISRQA